MTCQHDFEAHIRSLDGDYNLMKVGDVYIDVETQIEWRTWQKAWQAALASQQSDPQKENTDVLPCEHQWFLSYRSMNGVGETYTCRKCGVRK